MHATSKMQLTGIATQFAIAPTISYILNGLWRTRLVTFFRLFLPYQGMRHNTRSVRRASVFKD